MHTDDQGDVEGTRDVTIITGGDVITMNPARDILKGGAVAMRGTEIVGVGATSDTRRAFPGATELDARGCVITPGLISGHHHLTGDPLVRSCLPDNLDSGTKTFGWSVPLHAQHTPADDEMSAVLSCGESATRGVTTMIEAGTVAHPDRVAAGALRVGTRLGLGTWGWDAPDQPFAYPAREVLARIGAVLDAYPPGGLVTGWVTLVGHDLATEELLVGAADLARSRGVRMTMHMSPGENDSISYLATTGRRPLVYLEDIGVMGDHLLLAHCLYIDDAEIEVLLRTDTAVAWCPWGGLRSGSGVVANTRHAELFQRGLRIGLGCDTVNSGDSVDLLRAGALASGLSKDAYRDAAALVSHDVLEMITIRGARAVGLADRIGSLEVGKRADVVVHDASGWHWTPRGDIVTQLVWSSDGQSVRDVFVDGRMIVRGGECLTVDLNGIREEANRMSVALLARTGIELPHKWPETIAD
ncbi:MAG: putative hydrolase [Actinomycetia bacterium]|nr:putative hydrolase [Actinomycetes bacterium]